MIPFDFIYFRPETTEEAVKVFFQMEAENKNPMYYGGGSEIITMSRAGSIRPGAVIDLKGIQDCLILENRKEDIVLGAANTLNRVKESNFFHMLGKACGRIADHTNQCRITLGGNLCGSIIYRETSLPLMLADAQLILFGSKGERRVKFSEIFDQRMKLEKGEFISQVIIPDWVLHLPFVHVKKTTNEKIDYPLINVTAIKKDREIRLAFSGLCSFPFRNPEIENIINDRFVSIDERINKVLKLLPEPALTDVEGSGEYRLFVLKNTLNEVLEAFDAKI